LLLWIQKLASGVVQQQQYSTVVSLVNSVTLQLHIGTVFFLHYVCTEQAYHSFHGAVNILGGLMFGLTSDSTGSHASENCFALIHQVIASVN
jgi:hypothetical protein